MSSEKRKYELKARAERQRETRRRIVDATVALHEEVGPAKTTVAEIARRAGVQRLTVYNHFPDDGELYRSYRDREPMTGNVLRDRAAVPALDELMARTMDAQLAGLVDALAAGFRARGKRARSVRAALVLAVDFWTWQRLRQEGLDDATAAEVMTAAVSCQLESQRPVHRLPR